MRIHHFTFQSWAKTFVAIAYIFISIFVCTVLPNWQPKIIWCPTLIFSFFFFGFQKKYLQSIPFDCHFWFRSRIPVVEPQSMGMYGQYIFLFQLASFDGDVLHQINIVSWETVLVWASYNLGRDTYTVSRLVG